MGFDVTLYYFAKKINSTARPTDEGITYSCILKESSGILNPAIGLQLGVVSAPSSNYAFIESFNRYYYIKEWNFINGLWWAEMTVDVLASWKTEIGATTCYITRSAAANDGAIQDNTYPATGRTTIIKSEQESPWVPEFTAGRFIVAIAGAATRYYLFTETTLKSFLGYLFSDAYAEQLTTGWSQYFPSLKAQCNPLQYVISITWVPFAPSGQDVDSIRVGWADVPIDTGGGLGVLPAQMVEESLLGRFICQGSNTFNIARHPQAERGVYLNNAPYSMYTLFFPPWGKIQLDSDVAANSAQIIASWVLDLRTTEGTLTIKNENGFILSKLRSQIGVPHQVTQIINRGYGLGNVLLPVITSQIAGAAVGGAVGAAAGGIMSAAHSIGDLAASKIPTATTLGSNGSMDSLFGLPTMQYEFKEVVSDDNANRGKPLCANRQISTLGGYMQTVNAHISIAATANEKDSIINYMEGGFYYE